MRVVEVAGLNGPDEGGKKPGGQRPARRDEQNDDAHDRVASGAIHRVMPMPSPITVIELTGMRMAAASGVSDPIRASQRPPTLYTTDRTNESTMTCRVRTANSRNAG